MWHTCIKLNSQAHDEHEKVKNSRPGDLYDLVKIGFTECTRTHKRKRSFECI